MNPHRYVIGLGANLGARLSALHLAQGLLRADPAIEVEALSRVYESPPLGPPQPDFLNAAVLVRTRLSAFELLSRVHAIEAILGREREVTWGPRSLDMDLLWSDVAIDHPELQIPHAHLEERWWALRPLLDVAPFTAARYEPLLARFAEARPPLTGLELDRPSPSPLVWAGDSDGASRRLSLAGLTEGARLDRLAALGLQLGAAAADACADHSPKVPREGWRHARTEVHTWPCWRHWAVDHLNAPQAGKYVLGVHANPVASGVRSVRAFIPLPAPAPAVSVQLDDREVRLASGIGYH